MRRFLILFLATSSLLFTSCAVGTVKGMEAKTPEIASYPVTYFSNSETDYVYKAHISIYGKDFGGIFIAKKINDTLYRAAFTTEFGNKLFDFEITDDSFKVNYVMEELDRKIVLNTLKRDFMLLLKQKHAIENQYADNENLIYKSRDGKRFNFLFLNKETGMLSKIVNTTKSKEKIVVNFAEENDILAKKIVIDHQNIKLKIELNYIQ